jgi:hypothetical protein
MRAALGHRLRMARASPAFPVRSTVVVAAIVAAVLHSGAGELLWIALRAPHRTGPMVSTRQYTYRVWLGTLVQSGMNECVLALGVEKMQPGCGKAHIIVSVRQGSHCRAKRTVLGVLSLAHAALTQPTDGTGPQRCFVFCKRAAHRQQTRGLPTTERVRSDRVAYGACRGACSVGTLWTDSPSAPLTHSP